MRTNSNSMVDLSLDFSYEVILFLLLFCSLCITESYSLLTESPSLTLSTNATAEPNGSNTNIKPELFRQEDIKSQGALNDHFTQVLRAKAINPNLASLKSGEFMSFTPFDPSLQPSSQIVSKNNRIKLWIDNFGDNAANIRGFSFVYRNITLDCLLSVRRSYYIFSEFIFLCRKLPCYLDAVLCAMTLSLQINSPSFMERLSISLWLKCQPFITIILL